jgi:flagellar basal body-associated protein FliL
LANAPQNPNPLDDWDNLPLDPTADDWDETPAPPATGQATDKDLASLAPLAKTIEDTFDRVSQSPDWLDSPSPASEPSVASQANNNDFDEDDEFLDLSPLVAQEEEFPPEAQPRSVGFEDSLDTPSFPEQLSSPSIEDSSESDLTLTKEAEEKTPLAALADEQDAIFDFEDALSSADKNRAPLAQAQLDQDAPSPQIDKVDQDVPDVQDVFLNPEEEGELDADDPARADFLKTLSDLDGEDVPKKVELDLDGIFNEAKREADNLSPEATRLPEEAPPIEPEKEILVELPSQEPNLSGPIKFARYKILIFFSILGLAVAGLGFGAYQIFFKSPPQPKTVNEEYQPPSDLAQPLVKIPGVLTLERFYVSLGEEPNRTLVEMEIILHYQDEPVAQILKNENVVIRDLIFRLTKTVDPSIVTEMEERRQLQANLLSTLNNLPQLHSDPTDPALTYVQISLLKKR